MTTPTSIPTVLLAAAIAALPLTAALTAQACPRTEVQLSSGNATTSLLGFDAWRLAAPKEALPADPARNLAATSRVVYALWPDRDGAGNSVVRFLRSTDGGWSWNAAAATSIWTANTAAGESFDASFLELHAEGHAVFVTLVADRDANGNPNATQQDSCWILGSRDQGQTWQAIHASRGIAGALSTGDVLLDVDRCESALANGRCHVAYEADYVAAVGQGGAGSQAQDIYYQAAEFSAAGTLVLAFPEERRMETIPSGSRDADTPFLAADGSVVVVGWQEDRVQLNDTYSRVSNDGGASFGAEVNHTNFVAAVSLIRRSRAAVDGTHVYVLMEDSRNGVGGDDIHLDISSDAGSTWTFGTMVSQSPANIDSDGSAIWADGGTIVIAYIDDRQGSGNVDNDVYAVIDRNFGADFLAGTAIESTIFDTPTNCTVYRIDGFGDTIAIAAETSDFPEDAAIAVSSDRGQTWSRCWLRSGGVADVDDLDIAVTINRDVCAIWQDDQNLGNTANNVYVNGTRATRVEDRTATGGGIALTGYSPAEIGAIALLIPSLAAPASNAIVLDAANGILLNFVPDLLTVGAFNSLSTFLGLIDANREVVLPLPNLAPLIGMPIHWVGIGFDIGTGRPGSGFTDPFRQN